MKLRLPIKPVQLHWTTLPYVVLLGSLTLTAIATVSVNLPGSSNLSVSSSNQIRSNPSTSYPPEDLRKTTDQFLDLFTVISGGLLSLVLFGITRSQVQQRIAAEQTMATLRQSEQALRESEERFHAFMNHNPASAWITDRDGRVLYLNNTYHRMFNLPQDALGKTIHEVYEPEFANDFLKNIHEVSDSDRMVEAIESAPRPDGTVGKFLVYKFPILDASKKCLVGGVAVDITESKHAEELVRRSEIRFRMLVEQSPLGIQVLSPEGKTIQVNKSWERLWGIKLAELDQYNIFEDEQLISKGIIPYIQQGLTGQTTSIPPVSYTVQQSSPDGSGSFSVQRWVQSYIYPVKDESGNICEVVLMHQDITERKRAEEAVRQSEERLRLALDAGRMGAWEWNMQTNVQHWDAGQYALFGLEKDTVELTPNTFFDLVHPDDLFGLRRSLVNLLEHGGSFEIEFRVVRPNGVIRWLAGKGMLIQGSNGEPDRMLGVNFDITERKRAEQERDRLLEAERAARSEAEAANRIKDEFLATLSHELRSPLNAILGWLTLLRTRQFDEVTTARALETVERNARAQAQLVEDLLDVSRIIQGQLRLNVRPIALTPVIEAALDTVRPAAEAKGIGLYYDLDAAVEPVSGDAGRLQQIVWNLLTNAVKFTPKGGQVQVQLRRVEIEPDALEMKNEDVPEPSTLNLQDPIPYAEITVSDTGKGISSAFLPYVFERFRQADSSITRSYGGLGLGLAIVRHLVELHGGTIHATSNGEGQGATFTVRLPLTAVSYGNHEQDRNPQAASNKISYDCGPGLKNLRILIVDDEVDARDLLVHILQECGADVVATANTNAAIATLISQTTPHSFDILVSDIGMPDEDGYSLLRRVRSLTPEQGGRIPALALTAYARAEDRQAAFLAGFQAHVAKPVEPAELIAAIANLAGRTG